ncbi:MAG: hypothetical protein FJ102_12520 [Deltaproteobacteria bacterium]|nr:hypothetical protein [Deltaproteobacteria bacterium]
MDASVVNVRVQVIDLKSFVLDLQVPTYLPARDLTQRIARDAGLEAHWADGKRRLYFLRARGRLLRDDEKLQDLGVINGELVYLLPEPPHGSGVVEQPPEYPETHDYAGAGWLTLIGSFLGVTMWAVLWGIALTSDRGLLITSLPGFALGFLCTSLARHAWGGTANRVRIAATALVLTVSVTFVAFLTPIIFNDGTVPISGELFFQVYADSLVGFILGVVGVFLGWLAWWGAVEPLPPREVVVQEQAAQVAAVVPCGICGQPVDPSVRTDCQHACGKVFHQGCYRAKAAVYRGDKAKCAVCGNRVA